MAWIAIWTRDGRLRWPAPPLTAPPEAMDAECTCPDPCIRDHEYD